MSAPIPALAGKVGELLRQMSDDPQSLALEEVQYLLHEMELRQRELERQNEELRRTQRYLEAYRDRYIDLYDFAPLGYVTLDEEGFVQEINLAGAKLLGAERDVLTGYAFDEYVANEDREAFLDHVRRCVGEHREVTSELRLVPKVGPALTAQFHSIPIEGPADITLCKTAIADITERRRAEDALEQERDLLRTLIDNLPDCVYIKNAQGRFVAANLATARIMGTKSPNDLLGKGDADFYPPQLAAEYRADEEELLRTGQPLVNKDEPHVYRGESRTVLTTKVPLRDRQGKIVGLVGISRDITDRKQGEQALQQAKADAEKANQAKSRFLAYVSHDLRTPMTSILGMVDLALERTTDPTTRDFLRTAKDSADFLLALLNDLLDSARIESGKLEVEAAPFSLRRVLSQTARVLALRAGQKGISYSCSIPPEVPDNLVGDQVRLRQILMNLAGNGIKFTEQGEVAVSVRVDSQTADEVRLEFAVRDTGIGIPQSELKRIFQPFAQADPSTMRRFGGTGLGLTISTRLVALMHGRIWVESELDHGSTFHFTARLPLAKELVPEPDVAAGVCTPAIRPLRILLVEDNPANQKLAAYILRFRGHTVEIAGSGRQALRMTQQVHYDAILMDVLMPGMDGLETTAALRAREIGAEQVPIIAMTAHAMKGDREQCLEAGMDGYLSKPIDRQQMIALVETLAAGKAEPDAGKTSG